MPQHCKKVGILEKCDGDGKMDKNTQWRVNYKAIFRANMCKSHNYCISIKVILLRILGDITLNLYKQTNKNLGWICEKKGKNWTHLLLANAEPK